MGFNIKQGGIVDLLQRFTGKASPLCLEIKQSRRELYPIIKSWGE